MDKNILVLKCNIKNLPKINQKSMVSIQFLRWYTRTYVVILYSLLYISCMRNSLLSFQYCFHKKSCYIQTLTTCRSGFLSCFEGSEYHMVGYTYRNSTDLVVCRLVSTLIRLVETFTYS